MKLSKLVPLMALLGIGALAAGAQTCACDKVGDFATPASTNALNQAMQSPDGTYSLQVSIDNQAQLTSFAVKNNRTGKTVLRDTTPIAISWGFSPDNKVFVFLYLDGNSNRLATWTAYDITKDSASRIATSSVLQNALKLSFSPSGRYLQQTALTSPQYTEMTVYDLSNGATAFQTAFQFYVQSGKTPPEFGVVSAGFGPNDANPRFFYAYTSGQNAVEWRVADLAARRTSITYTTLAISSSWSFSPCADVLAFIAQTSPSYVEVTLFDTKSGGAVASPSGFPLAAIKLTATAQSHIATVGGQNYTLAANKGCGNTTPATGGGGGGTIVPPLPTPRPSGLPVGAFDGITQGGQAWGWAYDPNDPGQSIQVHLYVGGPAGSGEIACLVNANLPRPDVNAARSVPGAHGFQCQLPSKFANGNAYQVFAYGIDVTGDPNAVLGGSPRMLLWGVPRQRSGIFGTDDPADSVRWSVDLDAAPDANSIVFQLCQSVSEGWGKWMTLPDGKSDLYVEKRNCVSRAVPVSQLNFEHEIYLHKAKFFGARTRVKRVKLSFFSPLPPGSRLTIDWLKE